MEQLFFRLLRTSLPRLALASASLFVGALTLATTLGLIGSVERFFRAEARTLVGGDVVIEGQNGAPVATSTSFDNLLLRGARFSHQIETLAVIRGTSTHQEARPGSLLISLKVVDDSYPLYGSFTVMPKHDVRKKFDAFVGADVLVRMGLSIGDTIDIGKARFTISGVITDEPDRIAGGFRLGPPVLVSMESWSAIGIEDKEGRVERVLAVALPDSMNEDERVKESEQLRTEFRATGARVSIATEGPRSLLRSLESAERFFFTMIVLALFLVIVNVRVNLVYLLASFQKTIAIMRALGMRRHTIVVLFLVLLALTSLLAGVAGSLSGGVTANLALPIAETYIESTLPRIAPWEHLLVTTLFTLLLCLSSAWGFLARVTAIEPRELLLGYGRAHGVTQALLRELPGVLLTLMGLFVGIWYLTERAVVALAAVSGIAIFFAVLLGGARLAIRVAHRARMRFPFPVRAIINFLAHQGIIGTTAIASLSIALSCVFAVALLEVNVLQNLQGEFRKDAPNVYAIDIQSDQIDRVREVMGRTWNDFTVHRARFMKRDDFSIQDNLDKEDGELRREFNVTARSALIEGERVVAGTWHGTTGVAEVSVDQEFAKRAKLRLGTRVQFMVQGFLVEATVTSLRDVDTTSGLPFFYLVFSPDVLSRFPSTSFGYAYIPESEIPVVQRTLATEFPNISSIPTTQIIETVSRVVGALSVAVTAIAIPALFLGVLLMISLFALTMRERLNDMLVFGALGAKRALLFMVMSIESLTLVTLSSVCAIIIASLCVYGLNRFVFDFSSFYLTTQIVWIVLVITGASIVLSFLLVRAFARHTPVELLRKN